jgi:peptidyl-prolyl cis-trans isomerase A (cyclophilin A)
VEAGFYSDIAFFRVLDGFVAQFGISGDPAVASEWRAKSIQDDPVRGSNTRGTVTFAMAGPNTRTTQLFINYGDNSQLDKMGFSPFAEVVEGLENIDALHSGYGEGAPRGRGPDQGRLQRDGNAYLKSDFPELDYILSATIL